jgi:2-dehydro-3-deoxyphosphooctonate aldolase (KDO 8-P synthase)|tara:strand:- start:1221 stop:2033 length:813 start_codon:yes stop_codon:yes gene_type:complete
MVSKLNYIKNIESNNFFLIAGPCVIESEEETFKIAKEIKRITDKLKIPFIFKGSFKKANRTRLDSFSGIGDEIALKILKNVREELKIPILTDIHTPSEAKLASKYVDVLQIPAFLCRQTDLLVAAARTSKHINIKKGQFLSAQSMKYAVEKINKHGNENIFITERGTMFGYQDLVIDYRSIPVMQEYGYPVILDITHSLQEPNNSSGVTGGKPKMIETIAKAGIATGVDGIFLETHPNPKNAKSDGANMLALDQLEELLVKLIKIQDACR